MKLLDAASPAIGGGFFLHDNGQFAPRMNVDDADTSHGSAQHHGKWVLHRQFGNGEAWCVHGETVAYELLHIADDLLHHKVGAPR